MTNMLETELTVGSHKYRAGRMSVFEQMDVAADFRDILVGLALMKAERPKDMTDKEYQRAMQFIMASRGNMTPEARHRVMNMCLSKVQRNSGTGWAPVLSADNTLQFDDIDLPDFVTLAYAVLEHNKLIDFFGASPSTTGEQTEVVEETGPHLRRERIG
jgi:hypothetical protein